MRFWIALHPSSCSILIYSTHKWIKECGVGTAPQWI